MTDIGVEYISGDELDESRVIAEQSFDVDLNNWGEVRFVSYRPTYDTLWEDVSFVLTKDNQIIYYFPAYFENNSTENDGIGMFDSVDAVGFQDIDGYRTIYQRYFADEGYDFMISYGANGNSRIILKENEEIIEYLVYDRISENEKYYEVYSQPRFSMVK